MTKSGRFWVKQSKRNAHDGPPRAALLMRQSIRKVDSISLDDQEARNRAYAAERGYVVVDAYRSPGIKGWREDRADHAHFRELAERGEIDAVISYDVFRCARTMRLMEQFAHDLERAGVRLEFSSQPMANDPLGRQMITMLAEFETAARSVKIADTFDALRRRGQWHGVAPYGYARKDRTIVPDATEAPILTEILRRALRGAGTVSLRDWLIGAGVRTRHGGQWSETHLSRLLRNPVYAGGMRMGDEVLWPEGEPWWEPLIDRADWERLQALLPTRAHTRSKPVQSWCEGIVTHACGERMYLVETRIPNGERIGVYRCKHRSKPPRCRLPHAEVSARNLETAARSAILAALATPVPAELVIREAVELHKAEGALDARRSLAKRRDKLAGMRRQAAWHAVQSPSMRAEFAGIVADLDAQMAALAAEEAALPAPVDPAAIRALAESVAAFRAAAPGLTGDELALLLRELGGALVVGDGGVTIRFPPDVARIVPSPEPVRIYRARTR